MIRDFWKIQKDRLINEIKELKTLVDPLTWQAIDAVRKVGNIGAHMEQDINLIVEVDPLEAAKLIGLIELLMSDWYVARHNREEHLHAVVAIGEAKKEAKTASPAKAAPAPSPAKNQERESQVERMAYVLEIAAPK
jgi:Domain of unknown function (DUF4145)